MVGGESNWNLKIKGSFSLRADTGTVNSSPITTIAPVVKLLRNCNSVITIPGIPHVFDYCAIDFILYK